MNNELKFARRCNDCKKGMNQGYVIEQGEQHYCSDECLNKHISHTEYLELYDNGNGDTYWTDWEEIDADDYYTADGANSIAIHPTGKTIKINQFKRYE